MIQSARILSLTFVIPLVLAACAGPQTSVEKTGRHMAYQLKKIHFDPNTQPLTADNSRVMAEFLVPFYELGKKDRAAGLTSLQAQQRVNSFTGSDGPFSLNTPKTVIINKEYDADQPVKRIEIMKSGAIQTYWDGYNGRP